MTFKTELIYYNDPYKVDFRATVLSVEKVSSGENFWDVIMDRTCFYPEGGGQPSDTGLIDGIQVKHVVKKDGEVFHRLVSPPNIGKVDCKIDWEHRFDYMQQHTGQHILSGALHKLGYGTVSVHQGENVTTIEIDKSDISKEDLKTIEVLANGIISENIKLKSEWVSDSKLEQLSLRRQAKVSGEIRIISVGEFDMVACGGVHTESTGEIQCVKYLSVEKIRGHARISWKIGNRVLKDYEEKALIISTISSIFSARQSEILLKVEDMLNSIQENRRVNSQLEDRYINLTVKDIFRNAEKNNDVLFFSHIFENESKGFLRNIVNSVKTDSKFLICLINKTGLNFQWILASGSLDFPFSEHKQNLLQLIDARGGGKAPVWQGVGDNFEGLDSFFDALRALLSNT
ncbi:MAG: alanyl-tRNA editing protein [Spirochaetales bacterium]|nr:alanyl-tRNA editing protein [Spirochaetales bacterium]